MMRQFNPARLRRLAARGLWLAPALVFLLVALGTQDGSSYFLHFDTPTQDAAAIDLLRGCWGYSGHKPVIMLLLAVPFALGGISPLWETALLAVLGAVSVAATFQIASHLLGSRRWALLAALWLVSLPSFLYFSRIHVMYPLAFFLLAVWLQLEEHPGWAGLMFGLSLLAHANFMVPIAAWLGFSVLLDSGFRNLRSAGRLAVSFLLTYAAVEFVRYLFTGEVLGWTRYILFDEVLRQAGSTFDTRWTHVVELIAFTNGWPNAIFLLLSILYLVVRRPRVPAADVAFATAWSMLLFFSYRAAADQALIPRMWVTVYPLAGIVSLFTLRRITGALQGRLPGDARRLASGVIALAVAAALIPSAVEAAAYSRTRYPVVARAMEQAAQAGLPVRYFGNFNVANFYAAAHHTEAVINEPALDVITGDTRAVLVFEIRGEEAPATLAGLCRLGWDRAGAYTVTRYDGHLPASRHDRAEVFYLTSADLEALRGQTFAPAPSASTGAVEVWWPRRPAGEFTVTSDPARYIYYYPGDGCLATPPYAQDTKWWYEIILEKLASFAAPR